MQKTLENRSKSFEHDIALPNIKNILGYHNPLIIKRIEENYPLTSLIKQPFVLWYSNGFVFQGEFKETELPASDQYIAYNFLNTSEIITFFKERNTPVPELDDGNYFMFVGINETADIHTKDADFISVLFIKSPIELS